MTNSCGTQKNRVTNYLPSALVEVDQLFDQFFNPKQRSAGGIRAAASVWEDDNHLHVEIDLPGIALEDTDVTFDKGVLTVAAERKATEGRNYWHNERAFGKVSRTVTLPETADPESIVAELNAGVLHVSIAKLPEAQPRRIEVKSN